MGALIQNFKIWKSITKANKLKELINGATDPSNILLTNQVLIDDNVVEVLINESFSCAQNMDFEKAIQWAELAHKASTIGGSALVLADSWDWKASLLLELLNALETVHQEPSIQIDINEVISIRQQALECATQALKIYTQAGASEKLGWALGKISTSYQVLGEILPAFEYRLRSIVEWADQSTIAEIMTGLFQSLVSLYWQLESNDIFPGAKLLLGHTEDLETRAQRWLGLKEQADLYDVLGTACKDAERNEKVLAYWKQAVNAYQHLQASDDEFIMCARMQDFAIYTLEDLDQSIHFGEQCVRVAPNNVSRSDLANRYHLLGATYEWADRPVDAIEALHRAADLYKQTEDLRQCEGECLLQAAIQAEEIGAYTQALADLDKCLHLSGGKYTFWLAEYRRTLLLLGPCRDLGRAIECAEYALQMSISGNMNLTIRAASLMLAAQIYLELDTETALNRAELLIELQETDLESCEITINFLFKHSIFPPPGSAGYVFASMACLKLGFTEKANYYAKHLEKLAYEESNWNFPDELNEYFSPLIRYLKGEQLLLVSPQEAIVNYNQAVLQFLETGETQLAIQTYHELGMAYIFVNDTTRALEQFSLALKILEKYPNPKMENTCHYHVGIIKTTLKIYDEAYTHFQKAIELYEKERASLSNIVQREKFAEWSTMQEIYKNFIEICVRLGRLSEALIATENIKSRVLVDLLSQEEWKAVDYQQLGHLDALYMDREEWYKTYIQGRFSESELKIPMLDRSIEIDQAEQAIRDDLLARKLLLQIELQEQLKDFDEIRRVCSLSNNFSQ